MLTDTSRFLLMLAGCVLLLDCRPRQRATTPGMALRITTYNIEDVRTADLRWSDHPRLICAAARIQHLAPDVFIAALGEEAERWVFRTSQELRNAGLHVAHDLMGRSLKAQMKEANRQNAPYAMIIGGNELEAEAATVKEMESGEQEEVSFDELSEYLRATSG